MSGSRTKESTSAGGNRLSRWLRSLRRNHNSNADDINEVSVTPDPMTQRGSSRANSNADDFNEVLVTPDPRTQCGNCHAKLEPGDRYCRVCGTRRGEGAYKPYRLVIQCVYGPMPENSTHRCTKCGYIWTTCAMIDNEKYCPMCGGPAPADLPLGRPAR